MKKKIVLFFVFDGFADWEASYALAGINKSDVYQIKTISIDKTPVKSMGGVSVCPDLDFLPETDLRDLDAWNTAMLILPGGSAWEEKTNDAIAPLVTHCINEGIPLAAICGATVFLADLGILNEIDHTSNDPEYLQALSPFYEGHSFYRHRPAVESENIITASGTSAIEFADSIFETLGISDDERVRQWFCYFQNKAVNFNSLNPALVLGKT